MLIPLLQIANALVFFQLTSFIVRLIKRFRVSVWRNNELHCPLVSFSTYCINVVYTECSPWTERTLKRSKWCFACTPGFTVIVTVTRHVVDGLFRPGTELALRV